MTKSKLTFKKQVINLKKQLTVVLNFDSEYRNFETTVFGFQIHRNSRKMEADKLEARQEKAADKLEGRHSLRADLSSIYGVAQ